MFIHFLLRSSVVFIRAVLGIVLCFSAAAMPRACWHRVAGLWWRCVVHTVSQHVFTPMFRHLGLGMIMLLGADNWFCLCWVGVCYLGFIASLVLRSVWCLRAAW